MHAFVAEPGVPTADDHGPLTRVELSTGIELHFIEKGRGAPVVLLHGGMGDCCAWAGQMDALAAGYRTIAYSRRHNHPNKNANGGGTHILGRDVDDLGAFNNCLQIGPAHLVGTSYGALVALAFAMAHPDQVLSLVLAEPPLHPWACRTPRGTRLYTAFMEEVWHPAAEAFDRGNERQALRLLTDGIWGRANVDARAPSIDETKLRNVASMTELTRSLDPFPDLNRSGVAKLAMPVLLLRGEHASELHRCVVDELARALPGATRAEIAAAGHGSAHENRDGFNEVVLAFLSASTMFAP